jgi:hypothetical protein
MSDDADAPLTVARFGNLYEAQVAKSALEGSGIYAFIPGEMYAISRRVDTDTWFELQVRQRDQARAQEILAAAGHR